MNRDCWKQGFSVNEHEGVWELLRLKGTPKICQNHSTLSPHDAETETNISLKARSFSVCPGQNLGLWPSKENLSFLGLKQENYTKPVSQGNFSLGPWRESKATFCRWSWVSLSASTTWQSGCRRHPDHHRNEPMHRPSKRKFYGRFYTHTQIF